MRRVVLACGLLVLAACGSSSKTVGQPVTSTSAPRLTVPSTRAQRVHPTPGALDVHPVEFDPAQATAQDDEVLVHFSAGIAPCFVVDHYTVAEAASTVTIAVYAGRDAKKRDTVCAAIAVPYELAVPLRAPLGTRRVVDGATSAR